ncbi:type II CRISPR RNA-guided endonuclease Cas9 [Roseivirga pacifica]|uniref:type II CRISPR RNA-guided endonuclease Cas9 n=1 Tax=Roseivirga pacifica TaxID=1267423 RepID=UPI003BB06362
MENKIKRILGLDLGTTSVGWAYVLEHKNREKSSIQKLGVRVNPLTTDEQTNFEKGRPVSVNADRTLKRGMRRNLDRYRLRRENLLEILIREKWITPETPLTEIGKHSTFETLELRTKAVTEAITKEQFARVLLKINKKRGYKSSRKAKNEDEGHIIDGMAVAKRLYDENLTPGQLAYQLLLSGKKVLPDFYRSDLQAELDKVWQYQRQFYPEILTEEFKKSLDGKGQKATSASFWRTYGFNTAENKGTREQKKLQAYEWRALAIAQQLEKEEVAYVITEINNDLNKSSGYLGAISDRSKKLYFNKQTVGQYLFSQIQASPHAKLKNQVFYRQDYMDEFEKLWETQSKFHPELSLTLKDEVRDVVIFYQRKLKSQKGLVSFCQFESKEIEREENGKFKKRTIGLKVTPKSSPLFQEFKIWQVLGHLKLKNKNTEEVFLPDLEARQFLFNELNLKGNISAVKSMELLGYKAKDWEMNYTQLEGNRTQKVFYDAYLKILELEGYDVKELLGVTLDKDEVVLEDLTVSAQAIKSMIREVFSVLGIDIKILDFDPEIDGKYFEKQSSYQLWHLLHSAEDDNKKYSDEEIITFGHNDIHLKKVLCQKFGFKPEHSKIMAAINLPDDYGNLSAKAIRKIFPFIKEMEFDKAAAQAGYNHSSSLTKDENGKRPLQPKLEVLKKNSLRNPVVEKILNQMVNVVNALIDSENNLLEKDGKPKDFHFDEIRIELARELKKNAKERVEMTRNIEAAKRRHEKIAKTLNDEFNIKHPSRNDIIKYKLYEELKNNGYKDLYTNTYIPREKLFTKEIDIEHIIPRSRLFDDSFSNKTLTYRRDNLDKGDKTAFDYIESKYGTTIEDYTNRVENLFTLGRSNFEEGISKAKYKKLLMRESEIGDGFIERDIREAQYIAKKAKQMLEGICRSVVPTSGVITDRLRNDWGLINVMKELNLPKYRALGLTEVQERKSGNEVEQIIDWTKRNDHRHHAMDALTVAFTKRSHIQYLNFLNARKNEDHKKHSNIMAIQSKETTQIVDKEGNKKRLFVEPIPNFRQVAKEHVESILISHKAKNKVTTKNKNIIKTKNGEKAKIELTPRGQLHKETIYGKYHYYVQKEEKVGVKFDQETVQKVASPKYRDALLKRLNENGGDPKKAFAGKNSLAKRPLRLNETEIVPEKVKLVWLEEDFSIRKEVTPENFPNEKSIEKVIDEGIKLVLLNRLEEHIGNAKSAFTDLDRNPIWLNKEKGIQIKRVKIRGVNNAEPLHFKKDHFGNNLFDNRGNKIPVDFVQTGSNHHVAIYEDEKGNLQERVVSFYEVVARKGANIPIIDKGFNSHLGWKFLFTMKQNEMFVFPNEKTGFDPCDIDLLDRQNARAIGPNLFRVQKISTKNYLFTHHLETKAINGSTLKQFKELSGVTYHSIRTPGNLVGAIKIRLNHLGQIVKVGEY